MANVVLIFSLLALISVVSGIGSGKYEYLELTDVVTCKGVTNDWDFGVKFKNDDGKMNIFFNVTFEAPLDESIGVDFAVEQKNPTGYQLFYPYEDTNVCEAGLAQFPEILLEVLKCRDLEASCPIPEGRYECKKFPTRFHFENFPELPYGDFRATLKLLQDGTQKFCIMALATIVKKK